MKLDFSKGQGLTAEVCGISKSNVSRICKETETSKDLSAAVFMSPRKNRKTSKMKTILKTMFCAEPCLDFITQANFQHWKK